jgi:hypothetical protein
MFINRFFKYFFNRDFSNFKWPTESFKITCIYFKFGKYLHFKIRQLLTKFRLSDHSLEIELGRCKNIPRNQRHCKFCKTLEKVFLLIVFHNVHEQIF